MEVWKLVFLSKWVMAGGSIRSSSRVYSKMTLCNNQTPSAIKEPLYLTPGRSCRYLFADPKKDLVKIDLLDMPGAVSPRLSRQPWWVATSGDQVGSAKGRIRGLPIVYMYLHENPWKTHTTSTTDHSWIGTCTNRGNTNHGYPNYGIFH